MDHVGDDSDWKLLCPNSHTGGQAEQELSHELLHHAFGSGG